MKIFFCFDPRKALLLTVDYLNNLPLSEVQVWIDWHWKANEVLRERKLENACTGRTPNYANMALGLCSSVWRIESIVIHLYYSHSKHMAKIDTSQNDPQNQLSIQSNRYAVKIDQNRMKRLLNNAFEYKISIH